MTTWAHLKKTQLGKHAEYLAKMEFVSLGYDVFTAEVDDHGIDFVVRTRAGNHYDVQVKSFRLPAVNTPYVFVEKTKFKIHPSLLLLLVQFTEGQAPSLFLIHSSVNDRPNPIFASRDYGNGKQSAPEWGLSLSRRKLMILRTNCEFRSVLAKLS